MTVERHIRIPTRDGLFLTADLFLQDGQGPWPVLLHRTPYGSMWFADGARELTGDFAVVVNNCRGRFESEGAYDLGQADGPDGFDAVEWIARQPWCDGRVSGYGYSYAGHTQLRAAAESPPALASIAPILAGAWWKGLFLRDPGGPVNLAIAAHWLPRQASTDPSCKEEFRDQVLSRAFEFEEVIQEGRVSLAAALGHPALARLPLRDPWAFEGSELFCDIWRGIFDGPPPVSWFDDQGPLTPIETPTLIFNGWYDMGAEGSIETFRHISKTSNAHRLVMAPLGHGQPPAEFDPGEDAGRFGFDVDYRWAREWVLGDGNDLRSLDPVTYFTLGANEWRGASRWPPQGVEEQSLYLGAGDQPGNGRLSERPPADESAIGYRYNPRLPVPTAGGAGLGLPAGPCSQSGLTGGSRGDVLSFDSEPLGGELEITGTVTAEIFASSDCLDTDFTAKLIDVAPDGRAMSICDGIVRARYRNGIRPELLTPDRVERFRIHLGSISYLVGKGHRLRVDVSSSNFPRFDRNANTGAPEGSDHPDDLRTANNVLHSSRTQPSSISFQVMR